MTRRPWRQLAAIMLLPAGVAAQAPSAADLERFYDVPSIVGTPPRAVTWAPDSRRVAFLWAGDGSNFADVHVTTLGRSGPPVTRRVTAMPRPASGLDPAPPRDGTARGYTRWRAQRAALAAELDRGVASLAWLPDARRLVIAFRGDLWLVDTEMPLAAARRLTRTDAAESGVGVAPTRPGAVPRIAFLRDGDAHVATLDGDSLAGERRVTRERREAGGIAAVDWAPDGRRLAVLDVDRSAIRTRGIPDYLGEETAMPSVRRAMPGEPSESRRLGVVAADDGPVTWLPVTEQAYDVVHGWQWSPDAARLVVDVSDVFVKHRRLLVAEVGRADVPAAAAVRALVAERDSGNVSAEWQVAWTPDGRGVFYTSDRVSDYHVWLAPLDGGAPRPVTAGPFAVFDFAVTPDGVVVTANPGRPEERHLLRVAARDAVRDARGERAPVTLTRGAGTHAVRVSPDGRWGIDLFSADTVPPDLYLLDLSAPDAAPRRLTVSPQPAFAAYRFTPARYVTFPSRADGATLHARLLLPPGRRAGVRVPLIIGSAYSNTARNQWGGRNAHPLWGLDQVLLEQGFAILAVDVAGSSGHGTAFRRRIRLDYGGIDVEDLHSGVEWAVREGIADPGRVGIWGSSYGGLLTTMSLFTKPDVYRVGIAGAPATNVWHALTGEQRVMLRPQEHMDAYARASSHTRAEGLRGALMLIHGMRDAVVLYQDSAWLVQYLLQLGKDVELVTLPDAGHGWDLEGSAQTRFAFRRMVDFFRRTLLAP